MNSTFVKLLKCFNCNKYYSVEETNFPEDVFELIRKYELDNVCWICDACKNSSSSLLNRPPPEYRETDVHSSRCKKTKDDLLSKDETNDNEYTFPCGSQSPSSRSSLPSDTADRSARKHAQSILKAIKIPHNDKTKNNLLIEKVVATLLNSMKENEEFRGMMNRCYPTGSAYNDLKITSATEYDINLVLKVPKYVTLSPEFFEGNCTFVKLKWELDGASIDTTIKFFSENSDNFYLNPQKVLSWLQRHIDLALKKDLQWPEDVDSVVSSPGRLARTIIISTSDCDIYVDLVPVFQFEYRSLSSRKFYGKIVGIATDKNENNFFFAVPKKCTDDDKICVTDGPLCWRLDFPNAEKYILSGKECAKSVIRILKIFRDKKNWKGLASYYLKMVVILEILKDSSKEYWKNGNIHYRLLDSLHQLAEYLADGYLPHFLTEQNLIQNFNQSQFSNWSNHLKKVIKSWQLDPSNIVAFLEGDKQSAENSNEILAVE